MSKNLRPRAGLERLGSALPKMQWQRRSRQLYPAIFERLRLVITQNPALIVEGCLQSYDGVTHVKAEHIRPLHCADLPEQASHDFH